MGNSLVRLGELIAARRMELGYETQRALAVVTGVARHSIGAIERGDRESRLNTRVRLEQVLRWEPGSIRKVIDGGEPSVVPGIGPRRKSREQRQVELDEALERLEDAMADYQRRRREMDEDEDLGRGA